MKFCQSHWDRLKDAIEARGMGGLIAKSAEAVTHRIQQEVAGTATAKTFDPLMAAHWGICTNALRAGGLYLLTMDETGKERCPLCELHENVGAQHVDTWITEASEESLRYCQRNGLVPVVPPA